MTASLSLAAMHGDGRPEVLQARTAMCIDLPLKLYHAKLSHQKDHAFNPFMVALLTRGQHDRADARISFSWGLWEDCSVEATQNSTECPYIR